MKKKITSLLLATTITVSTMTFSSFSAAEAISSTAAANLIAAEGIVLLKNENNALPLQKGAKIALFGEGQVDRYQWGENIDSLTRQAGFVAFGSGSSRAVGTNGTIDPLDAFRQKVKDGFISLYEPLSEKYENTPLTKTTKTDSSHISSFALNYTPDSDMYEQASENADTAIVFISRFGGECIDFTVEQWYLTDSEKDMLKTVSAKFDRVIVVLNTSNAIDTSWAFENSDGIYVDAVIFAGYPGVQGGTAIADIICGKVNPSGKLTFTMAKDLYDYPTTASFLTSPQQSYTEDIFMGYRYFETFGIDVNYPFGYGLSYTSFDTRVQDFNVSGDTVNITVKVTNTGTVLGKEVVQVYFSAPQGVLGKPAKELCAFKKTRTVAPGESEILTLSFNKNDMASFDDLGKTGLKSCYVLEAGDYGIFVGNSVKNLTQAGQITVDSLTKVEQLTAQCPTNIEKRLLADGTFENINIALNDSTLKENSSLTVEAENYIEIGSTVPSKPGKETIIAGYLYDPATDTWNSGYTGYAIGSTYHGGSYLIYEINVEKAGDYYVSVRVATFASGSMFISSSTNKTSFANTVSFAITNTKEESGGLSAYYNLKDFDSSQKLKLQAGTNYIKIHDMGSSHPNIDSFTISSEKIPSSNNGTIKVDSSFYTEIVQNGTAKVVSFSGKLYDGSTWNDYSGNALESMDEDGSYIIYKVNASKSGDYTLSLKCAATVDNASFDVFTSSDGITYNKASVNFTVPNTSSGGSTYYSFKDIDASGTVSLAEGINYIKFAKGAAQTPNMACFSLKYKESETSSSDEIIWYSVNNPYEINAANIETPSGAVLYNGTSWDPYDCHSLANMWKSGAYAVYKVDVDQTGVYKMSLRQARRNDTVYPYTVSVSDDNINYSVAFTAKEPDKTSGGTKYDGSSTWYSFVDFTDDTYLITLKKGTNYIKFTGGTSINLAGFGLSFKKAVTLPEYKGYKLADVVNGTVSLDEFIAQMTDAELSTFFVSYYGGVGAGTAGASDAVCEKYGFKRFTMADGPAGLSCGDTAFPSETIIACTWNTDLTTIYASVIGSEAIEKGADMWLAPGMNLHRNPLGGRDNEYFSEDPFLSGSFGTAIVKTVQSYGVGVCVKHFICNEKEGSKLGSDSQVSERALRELYLEPFRMTVTNAHPWGVMSSYNILNGVAVSTNYDLLNNILREEWGYEGYIAGDWNNNKGIVEEINGGLTLRNPPSFCNLSTIISAVEKGEIKRATLENGAKAMLNTLMHTQSYAKFCDICTGGHNFENGICTDCNQVDVSKIASLSNDIGVIIEHIGTTYNTGEENEGGNENPTGNRIEGATLNIGSSLNIDYYACFETTVDNVEMRFTNENGVVNTVQGEYDSKYGMYKFTYSGINPQCMTDTIKAELMLKDGTILDTKENYSVKAYCDSMASKNIEQLDIERITNKSHLVAFRNLLADTLVYGAKAQEKQNYKTDRLADASDWVSRYKTTFVSPTGIRTVTGNSDSENLVKSVSLNMSNYNRIYFRLILTDESVKIKLNGVEVNREELNEQNDGTYILYTDYLKATEFDKVFTLQLIKDEAVISQVEYNVNAYIQSKNASSSVGEIVQALNNYGQSAIAYNNIINGAHDGDYDLDEEDGFFA